MTFWVETVFHAIVVNSTWSTASGEGWRSPTVIAPVVVVEELVYFSDRVNRLLDSVSWKEAKEDRRKRKHHLHLLGPAPVSRTDRRPSYRPTVPAFMIAPASRSGARV